MPDRVTRIRGQQYVTEVIAVGEDEASGKRRRGRSVNVFWSRNNKKQGTQNHPEGDILNYKKAAEMKRHYHLTRRHFIAGNKLHLGGDDRRKTKK
jgi:hypothetical protein